MSRRNRKKKQTSLLDDLKSNLGGVDREKYLGFWNRLPRFHRRALMIIVPVFLIALIMPVSDSDERSDVITSNDTRTPLRVEVVANTTSLSEQQGEGQQVAVTQTSDWNEYIVQSGDTLSKVFRSNNLPMSDLNALVAIEGLDKPLSKIKQGQLVRYKLTADGGLDILQLEKQGTSVMFFRLSDGGFGRSK